MADNTVVLILGFTNITGNSTGSNTTSTTAQVVHLISWLTFCIGLPTIGLAMYTLKNLSKGLLYHYFTCMQNPKNAGFIPDYCFIPEELISDFRSANQDFVKILTYVWK